MKTHPDAVAWEKWKKENAKSFNPSSLGSIVPNYYLENRLQRAFQDGMKAAREQPKKAPPTSAT